MKVLHVWYIACMMSIFVADRLTKMWALASCAEECVLTWWLSCQVMYNRGISWSMFDSDHDGQFLLVSALVLCITVLLTYYAYDRYKQGKTIFAEVAVIAGSISNIVDRMIYAGVVDFIVVHYKGWVYPVFNIADMAIVIGVIYMMWQQWRDV
jgi:signal peptidase II